MEVVITWKGSGPAPSAARAFVSCDGRLGSRADLGSPHRGPCVALCTAQETRVCSVCTAEVISNVEGPAIAGKYVALGVGVPFVCQRHELPNVVEHHLARYFGSVTVGYKI